MARSDSFRGHAMRDTSDVLANLSQPLDARPNRRVLRVVLSIVILFLLVFVGPLAVKKTVQWAVADLGISGEAGLNGVDGVAGANGVDGTNGLDGVAGVPGPQGLTGTMGMTGPVGATGATGAAGSQGVPGESGAPGAQGETGATGPQGPAGDTTPISIGQGSGQTAACDSDISVSMRSRWDGHRLVLGSVEFSRVSESCDGQRLSVYLIDFADELITTVVVESATVTSGNIRLTHSSYSEFDEIPSSDIHQVIIEMAS